MTSSSSSPYQSQQQPDRITVASLAPPQRTQAEAECKRQSTQGMMGGAGGALAGSYLAHKLMESSSPAYVTMSKNVKYAILVGVMGAGAYLTGRYFENKCRRERGLPPL